MGSSFQRIGKMANSKCRKQCLLKNDLPFQILIYNAYEKVCFGLPLSCQHYINETLKNGGFILLALARHRLHLTC